MLAGEIAPVRKGFSGIFRALAADCPAQWRALRPRGDIDSIPGFRVAEFAGQPGGGMSWLAISPLATLLLWVAAAGLALWLYLHQRPTRRRVSTLRFWADLPP